MNTQHASSYEIDQDRHIPTVVKTEELELPLSEIETLKVIVKHQAQEVDGEHPRFLRLDNHFTNIDDDDGKVYATLWDWELNQTLSICEDENEPSGWFWKVDTNEGECEMVLEVQVEVEERETKN